MASLDRVQGRQQLRYRVFGKVYEGVEGRTDPGLLIDFQEWSEEFGVSHQELDDAMNYLVAEGLLSRMTFHHYQLTHLGRCEYEESLQRPPDGTEHFPRIVIENVTNFGSGNVFGVVQTGGQGNQATATVTVSNAVTQNTIQQWRDDAEKLEPEQREEAHSLIEIIVEQLGKLPARVAAIKSLLTTLGALYGYAETLGPWVAQQLHLLGMGGT